MHTAANILMAAAFLSALFASGTALLCLHTVSARPGSLVWLERGQLLTTLLLSATSLILAAAFVLHDFSFVYVAGHSDYALPFFYRITAFWAGQEGSLLFWAWSVALCGSLFAATAAYKRQSTPVKLWFWAFFMGIMAFFLFLLSTWSNPFLAYTQPPADGDGLNPLLQNPGMIFHPPLLFLGYGGFAVPGCLALAHALRPPQTRRALEKKKGASPQPDPVAAESWARASRSFILTAWLFLGAGIILGAWWAYMELGWGGYWGWDPVENASLVPWLIATAYLHTAIVEERRGKLARTNVFLMALITVSAFFAAYIVRGNVVRSVHAFGDSAAGPSLLLFTATFLTVAAYTVLRTPARGAPLENPLSREGLLAMAAWILLALAAITLMATLWPVISRLWSDKSVGLGPSFYNYACLPFFTLLALMLSLCPWVRWEGGLTAKIPALAVGGLALFSAGALTYLGLTKPLPFIATVAGVGVITTLSMLFSSRPGLFKAPRLIAAHGVHFGFALIVLGISFSGSYKVEQDLSMQPGRNVAIGDYTFVLRSLRNGDSLDDNPAGRAAAVATGQSPSHIYREAEIVVSREGKPLGLLRPQLRVYAKNPGMPSTEAYTLFSLGNELYATFLGMDGGTAVIRISINPLVNWIWLGGILLCLFPLLGLRGTAAQPWNVSDGAAGHA